MSQRIPAPQPPRPTPRDETIDDTPAPESDWVEIDAPESGEDPWAQSWPDDAPLDNASWDLPAPQPVDTPLDAVDDSPLDDLVFEPLSAKLPDLAAPADDLLRWPWSSIARVVELNRELPVVLAPHEAQSTWFGASPDAPDTLTVVLGTLRLKVTPKRSKGGEGLCLGRDVLAGVVAVTCE